MTVTVTNLIQGPGTLYIGAYSATAAQEPADSAINAAPAASAWTDMGGTVDGANLEITQEYAELAVDQLVDVPGRRQTKRSFQLATNLAEATLENLARSVNESVSAQISTGANFKAFQPSDTPLGEPTYVALIIDGYAPSGFRRRFCGRRMLSTDPNQIPYKKDGQTVFSVKWMSHYVSSSVRPYRIVDQTA